MEEMAEEVGDLVFEALVRTSMLFVVVFCCFVCLFKLFVYIVPDIVRMYVVMFST